MILVLAMTVHTGRRLAEVAFLLIIISGIWLAFAQTHRRPLAILRAVVAGLTLAAAGVLLIVATHWGHYG